MYCVATEEAELMFMTASEKHVCVMTQYYYIIDKGRGPGVKCTSTV